MQKLWRGSLAVVLLVLWVAPARPAGKRHIPELGGIQIMLLRQRAVQEDMKLDKEVTEKIHDFGDKQWKKAQEVLSLPEEEQHDRFKQMAQENDRFLRETLNQEQLVRLNQITLQVAGLLYVTQPRVAEQLNLTAEQKDKAKQLQKEARQEAEELIHSTSKEQRKEKLRELRQTSRKRLMGLLNDDQKAKWKEMSGRPFQGHDKFHFDEPK